jgi:exportin-2 (importin alpha re-exporter)
MAFQVLESVFNRYRFEAKSQRLWEEIELVLKGFQSVILGLTKKLCGLIPANTSNKANLVNIFKCLDQLVKIFYSLSAQDIPAFFEDNMEGFFGNFLALIKFQNPLLAPRDDSEAGMLEKTQAGICEVLRLYTDKYEEQFNKLVPKFVSTVWDMLTRTTEKGRFDHLVPKAIRFLTSVVEKQWHKHLFGSAKAFQTLAEKVIIPQLKLRESDLELFEYNGIEYVRLDMEGSDVDTRRRTTVDFVRGMCRHHEEKITTILKGYVGKLLQAFQQNPAQWISKDAAMYIVMALAVKASTTGKGVTQVNKFINIGDFFKTQIIPELKSNPAKNPVLKADCLKFVTSFRTQLPGSAYQSLIPLIARYHAIALF